MVWSVVVVTVKGTIMWLVVVITVKVDSLVGGRGDSESRPRNLNTRREDAVRVPPTPVRPPQPPPPEVNNG